MAKQIFKILDVGNLYFPLKDVGKKFVVEDTITYSISYDRNLSEVIKKYNMLGRGFIYNEIMRNLWNEIRKDKKFMKKYKNYWLCPVYFTNFDKNNIDIHVDLLKPVK